MSKICDGYIDLDQHIYLREEIDPWEVDEMFLESYNLGALSQFRSMDPKCIEAFMSMLCISFLPPCAPNALYPVLPCQSVCDNVLQSCNEKFRAFVLEHHSVPEKVKNVFNCSANVPSWESQWPLANETKCSLPFNGASISSRRPQECPPFYEPVDPSFDTNYEKTGRHCAHNCCMKCPGISSLWGEAFLPYRWIFFLWRSISAVFCIMVALFLLKRMLTDINQCTTYTHVFFCISVCAAIWQAAVWISIGQFSDIQCSDPVTPSRFNTNWSCGIQGIIIIFGLFGLLSWNLWLSLCILVVMDCHG
jgi:hypothetical protein